MNARQEQEAVFWCGLLAPALFGDQDEAEVRRILREISGQEAVFPDGRRRKPSLKTLKRKLKLYRNGGFNALGRKTRSDRGQIRAVPPEVIATAIAAKKEQVKRSDVSLNLILKNVHSVSVKRSTLYRHLKAAGATRMKLGVAGKVVRKRWTCDHTHDMWVGDFEDGPSVLASGDSVTTYLAAFIDVHSRHITSGRYYLRENFDVLCDTLIRGIATHGVPRALYLDNAKVFHADALKHACYKLGIALLHRPKGDPAPGGLIERFFGTVQGQFESEVRASKMLTLNRLNEAFQAWLEVVYHNNPNAETQQSPTERYRHGLIAIRQADMEAVAESFLQRERRVVNKTFSDIQLHGVFYKVDPKLRGDHLDVRYNPFGPMEEVLLYSLREEYLGKGVRHQREHRITPDATLPSGPIRFDMLEMLIEQHRRSHSAGKIDFSAQPKRWPLQAYMAAVADLLGRRGGITSFNEEEFRTLQDIYDKHPELTRSLLKKAFSLSPVPTLQSVVHQLKKIMEE